jgi:hypothetical protein
MQGDWEVKGDATNLGENEDSSDENIQEVNYIQVGDIQPLVSQGSRSLS